MDRQALEIKINRLKERDWIRRKIRSSIMFLGRRCRPHGRIEARDITDFGEPTCFKFEVVLK